MPERATDITGLSFLTLELESPIAQTMLQVISETVVFKVHVF